MSGGDLGFIMANPLGAVVVATAGSAYESMASGHRCKHQLDTNYHECQLVKSLFEAADKNRNGRLSFGEFRIGSFAAAKQLGKMDVNRNGFVDPQEFHPCLAKLQLGISQINRLANPGMHTQFVYYMPFEQTIYI